MDQKTGVVVWKEVWAEDVEVLVEEEDLVTLVEVEEEEEEADHPHGGQSTEYLYQVDLNLCFTENSVNSFGS